jgi:two-component system phosphate regulon sensor histidine kinase PhoR
MLSRTWIRIALSYAALVLITAAILAFLLGDEFEAREEQALQTRLGDQARAVAHDAAPLFAQNVPVTTTNSLAHDLSRIFGTRVTLIKPDGVVVGDSDEDPARMENHSNRPEVIQALASPGTLGTSSRLSATVHRRLLYVATTVSDPANPSRVLGIARVAYPLTAVEQARDTLWGSLALAVLLTTLPALVLGTFVVRSIVGPLSSLREAAARFGRGDLAVRSHINPNGEIGDLGQEFNAMADRLSTTIQERTTERNQMAAVLAYMHDGIIITDPHGKVQSINSPAAQLFGTTPDKAPGRSLIEVTYNHELFQALQSALADPSERRRLEIKVGVRTLSAVVTAVPSPDGAAPSGLLVLQDVTELRRLERVRQDFVANIGHELRTPLASIKLLAETLGNVVHEDPQAADDFLRRIDIEVDDLTQLVRELLELSRIESGQVELDRKPVSVPELLERAASRLRAQAERAGLTLDIQVDSSLPTAYADPVRIEQVLVNLLHNAIKFTPPGGQVSLSAQPDDTGVRISVQDTGVGIPPDDLPRIFERFYKVDKARSEREGGTGLGLAIAKHIVQAHGGQIWAESQPGHSATFSFTLPTE